MKDLSILWKPATDIKPEELIGKQCRHYGSKMPMIFDARLLEEVKFNAIDLSLIEYLDESPDAVKELLKEAYCQGFDDGNSYFEIDHEETLRQTAERNFEDHFNH